MLNHSVSHLIRLFAIISLSYFLASCGEGEGPTSVLAEPCSANGVVSFDADSYPDNAGSAIITLTDSCIGYKTVDLLVDNGAETITVAVTLDGRGSTDPVNIKFGPTDDVTDTIAITEGDTLTTAYTDANAVRQTDTASILESSLTLGVYSETNIDPLLKYSQITNAADLGGYSTVTTEVATDVIAPLEGDKSLQAVFETDNPVSGNYNGFAFSFVGSIGTGANDLTNPSFEMPDASAGDVDCVLDTEGGSSPTGIPGWKCFNGAFVASNLFKPGGPDDVQNPTAIDGTQILKIFNADGLAQQSIAVTGGDNVHASVYAMNWTGDEFNNLLLFQLAFFDAGGNEVGNKEVFANTFDDQDYKLEPKDGGKASDWTLMEISELAPAGTVRAQILILQVLTDGTPNTGSVALDAARLYAGAYDPAPPLVDTADISSYDKLKFAINKTASSGLVELEVKMEDAAAGSASVFLSAYTPTTAGDWAVYEIPLGDFGSTLDKTVITSLGFYNASMVANTDVAYPALFAATLYFDDVHFVKKDTGPAPLTGVLLDSPVEGVTFSTETQSGITNVDGEFSYFAGEMVTFSVGAIVLGTVEGAPIITPVELTGGGNPVDQAAVNQLVFLQSIDEDKDPSNGMTISAATQAAAATQTLDFTLDSTAFTMAVTGVVNAITPAPGNPIVPEKTALDNFYTTYTQLGGTDVFDWSFPTQDYPAYPGTASFPVDFEDTDAPYFFSDFEGGVATVIANPQPTGNTSVKVAQMQKFAGETYGGSTLTLGELAYANGTVFTMKVWASRPVPVTLKLEGPDNVEQAVSHTGSGSWEELVFVFNGINAETGADVRAITLIFDNGVAGDAANDADNWTFYFDDINLVSTDPTEYKLIFSDEFDGTSLDTNNWTIETGYGPDNSGWGNNEWQNYQAENVKVEGGSLVITADCPTAPDCGVRDGTVTSGRINTLDNYSFKYGIAEARIKAPVQKATWPAFWMLGKNFPDVGWPFTGEVDIMEIFAYQSDARTTHAAMHWCDETVEGVTPTVCFPTGWKFVSQERAFSESLGDDFHVFSAEWNEDRIIAKIDGIEYFNQVIDPDTMDEFLKEFFLILNVAVGGSLGSGGQDPDGTEVWPQSMLVDYVRVYQLIPASPANSTISVGDASVVANGTSTTITVQVKDDNGNNFIEGGDIVTLTATGNALLSVVTDVGDGTYTATLSNLTAETVTVSGTINGAAITSGNATVSFTPGAASSTKTTITSDSVTPVAGTPVTITVEAFDANGNLSPGADVVLSVGGSASVTTATDIGDGTYTATLSNTVAEMVTVTGTIDGFIITDGGVQVKVPVTFIPGSATPANTTIASDSPILFTGETATITVQAIDANGNLTTGGDTVVLTVDGSAALGAVVDKNDGTYTATLSNLKAEPVTVSGSINGAAITSGDVSVTFIPRSASPENTTIASDVSSLTAGTTATITVAAFDTNGTPAPGAVVVLSVDGSAILGTVVDGMDGTYTATLSNLVAEEVTVTGTIDGAAITSGGVPVAVSVAFTPGAASPENTTIVSDVSSLTTGTTATITVQARDANDNPTTGDAVVLSVDGSATLGTVVPGVNGTYTATLSNLVAEEVTVTGTINGATITSGGVPVAVSVTFTPGAASPANTTIVSDVSSLTAGTTATITVQARDANDNPTTGDTVVLSVDGSATLGTVVEGINGAYTATLDNTVAELVNVSGTINGAAITSGGVPVAVSVAFTPGAVSASGTTIVALPSSVKNDGSISTITVQARDEYGNIVTTGGDTVVLSTDDANDSAILSSVIPEGSGAYTATISNTEAETLIINGTINGGLISSMPEVRFTSNPATGSLTTIEADLTTQTAGMPVTITVRAVGDDGPLTIGGDSVVLSVNGSATLGTVVDGMDGTYTATLNNTVAELVNVSGTINGAAITSGGVPVAVSVAFTPGAVSASGTTIVSDVSSLTVGDTATITVQARDEYGNAVGGTGGDTVVLSVDGSATLGTVVDGMDGTYTATLNNTVAEVVTVTGTINGAAITSGAVPVAFTPGAASPANTTIVSNVSSLTAGTTATITVQARDANDNPTTGDAVVLSVDGSATLGTVVEGINGAYTATLDNTVAELVNVSGTINGAAITSGGVPVAVSVAFTPGAASPANTTIVSDVSSLTAGTTATITVQARDANNNPTTGDTVVLSVDGSATLGTVVEGINGAYTATLDNTVAELVNVSGTINGAAITSGGVPVAVSVEFTPGATSPENTTIVSDVSSLTTGTTATITVQARDANDNPTTGDAVVLSVDGSATLGTVVEGINGAYTATLDNTVAELVNVSGTINGAAITSGGVQVKVAVTFTEVFTISLTTISVSFDSAAADNGSNTGTVSTITVQAKNAAGENLGFDPGALVLNTDSGDALVGAISQDNGTYTTVIKNPVAEVVTIGGEIGGDAFDATVTVTFGNTIGVLSETNIDTPLSASESAFNDAACDQTVVLDDAVDVTARQPFEGDTSGEISNLPLTPTGGCVEIVINFGASPDSTIVVYSQDFEGMTPDQGFPPNDIEADGWVIFGNEWDQDPYTDPTASVLGFYGPFPAANGDPGSIQGVATGEGGDSQGDVVLSKYSDYNNANQLSRYIEGIVLQEKTIALGDIGSTWTFAFDAKKGNLEPDSSAYAFIKTLDPGAGFSQTNLVTVDTTSISTDWNRYEVSLSMSDAALAGQILQFGFSSTSTNYTASGVFYDNLSFAPRSVDVSGYATLKFAIDTSEVIGAALADMELKMEDADGNTASVYTNDYPSVPVSDAIDSRVWQVYEIPVADFTGGGFDPGIMKSLTFKDFSSTDIQGVDGVTPLTGTLYSDDLHFIETPPTP